MPGLHAIRLNGLSSGLLLIPLLWPTLALSEGISTDKANGVQAPALDSSHLVDTVLGLIAVLAVMLALAWLVKRFVNVPGVGKGHIQVLGGVSLGPRERAVMISVEGQKLLLGVAPGRVQTLHTFGVEQAPPEQPLEADFASHLRQAEHTEKGESA